MAYAITRKLDTFRRDPVGCLSWYARGLVDRARSIVDGDASPIRRSASRLYWQWTRHQLQRAGCLDLLSGRPANAYPPDCPDLWLLYSLVRERKPRCVLEFGSGCSTVVLAHALWQNIRDGAEAAVMYSVDADRYWTEVTERLMPAHLRAICRVSYGELQEVEHGGTLGFRHADVPEVSPDFIYLDGPDFTPERRVAVDVLDIEPRCSDGFVMVVDGRAENCAFLRKHLKARYRLGHHWPLERWKTTIFERV